MVCIGSKHISTLVVLTGVQYSEQSLLLNKILKCVSPHWIEIVVCNV